MQRTKEQMHRVFDQLKKHMTEGEEKLREWIYTYMSKTVSILESIEFSMELAKARKFRLTTFFIWLSIVVYRIESGIASAFNRKGK